MKVEGINATMAIHDGLEETMDIAPPSCFRQGEQSIRGEPGAIDLVVLAWVNSYWLVVWDIFYFPIYWE